MSDTRVEVDEDDGHVIVWRGSVGIDVTCLVEEALRENKLVNIPGKIVVSWLPKDPRRLP